VGAGFSGQLWQITEWWDVVEAWGVGLKKRWGRDRMLSMSLQVNNLSKSFGARRLFSNVTFAVNPKECVALVGSNGCGKSTLMRIILEELSPDEGSITKPKESRIGYLPQEIYLFEKEHETLSLWELVTQAFKPLMELKERLEELEHQMGEGEANIQLHETYDRLSAEYEKLGGYSWQAKAVRLLKGFGFAESRYHDLLSTFSGGWQMRGYFIRLLLTEPDYLLLDEPTNYLDIASIGFLENYLRDYGGGILIVSHDRYFLDELATSVVAILPEGSRNFKGNYSEFLEAREVWAVEAEAKAERLDREKKRVERFITRFRYKASKASQVQSRIKQLEKIEDVAQLRSLPKLHFKFPKCEESGEIVLKGEEITKAYGDAKVLKDVSFVLERGDRLAIVGENGAGKTTLMRILAAEDLTWGGKLETGYRVHFGYFAQDEEISFNGDENVMDWITRFSPLDAIPEIRNILGAFLFSGDEVEKKVRLLSGGEKSRLGLARMMLRPSNLLLLDEPTNHLDINSREALLNALEEFPGTVIIVSHDRFFLDTLANKILAIDNGVGRVYVGNYSEYLWSRRGQESDDGAVEAATTNSLNINEGDKKQRQRDLNKLQRQLSNKLQRHKREIEELEGKISEHEGEIERVEGLLSHPPGDWGVERLADLGGRHLELQGELEGLIAHWEALCEENEATEQELSELRA
jgi:ATP-binding cassette subfamily F protein 3